MYQEENPQLGVGCDTYSRSVVVGRGGRGSRAKVDAPNYRKHRKQQQLFNTRTYVTVTIAIVCRSASGSNQNHEWTEDRSDLMKNGF